ATDVLQRMAAWDKAAGQTYREPPADLAKQLGSLAADVSGSGQSSGRGGVAEVRGFFDMLGAEIAGAMSELGQSHPKPEEPLQLVRQSLARGCRSVPAGGLSPRGWTAARQRVQTQEVFTHYARVFEARAKLADGDVRAAERQALAGAQGFTRSHGFPRLALAEIYARANRNDRAAEQLRAALDAPEPALE